MNRTLAEECDRKNSELILRSADFVDLKIYEVEDAASHGIQRIEARNVGLIVGFVLESEQPPDRVWFYDFNNYCRVDVPGEELPVYSGERQRLLPLAAGEHDLRGSVFGCVTGGRCLIQIEGAAPGPFAVRQLYYDHLPMWRTGRNAGVPVLPMLALSTMRCITAGKDELRKCLCLMRSGNADTDH
jgi:hypothetical protein